MSKIRIIGRNIGFLVLNRLTVAVVTFFLFPFIVGHVGKELYGVYLLVMTITGYLGILDIGVMSALTKYVAEFNGKKDYEKLNKIINASFSFYVLIGVVIALLLFICSAHFSNFFKIEDSNIKIVKQLFFAAGMSAFLVWPLSTFRGAIQGLNLWNIDASVNIIVQIFNAIATFIILSSGYGIVHLFIATQILTISGSIVLFYIVKKKVNLKIIFPYQDIETFKFIFNFSFFMFLGSLINIFLFQVHNLIIGYFISVSAVSIYAVAFNIQNYLRTINSTIGAPAWTIASEMEGRRDHEGQKTLLFKGTKYMSALFLPVILIMFFYAEHFINYWMGKGFSESIVPAKIIILFWLFNGTMELATGMLSAKGIVRAPLFIQLSVAILNIAIGISLIKYLGITAVALGLTVSMVFVGFPLYLKMSLRSLKITFKEYFDKAVKSNLLFYLFVVLLSLVMPKLLYPKNIYFTLVEMAAIYITSILFYYLVLLDKYDRYELKKII
ncbi:MAG: oligosaccharide flippase family protein [Proteobacteria bacterium]|nr:oligosaccharide flippase family protein [Pseudomonadota bacterium]